MPANTGRGLPYPELPDPANVPKDMKALADFLDTYGILGGGRTNLTDVIIGGDAGTRRIRMIRTITGSSMGSQVDWRQTVYPTSGEWRIESWWDGSMTSGFRLGATGQLSQRAPGRSWQPIPVAYAAGIVNVTINPAGGETGSATATLPASRFRYAPVIVLSAMSSYYVASVTTRSTSSFGVFCRRFTTGTTTATVPVHWTAIQMTPTAATG